MSDQYCPVCGEKMEHAEVVLGKTSDDEAFPVLFCRECFHVYMLDNFIEATDDE